MHAVLWSQRSKMDAPCPCMLCKSNGMMPSQSELAKHGTIKQPPTILCRYIDYWRSMYNRCCCLSHASCDFDSIERCHCPRCCICCLMTVNPCDNCKTKNVDYYPCFHQQGVCKSYLRLTLPGEDKEVPMEIA